MDEHSIDAKNCQLELILTKGNNWPQWTLNNDFQILNESKMDFYKTVDVLIGDIGQQTNIVLERTGKTDDETVIENGQIIRDQTIKINRIWVNDVLLETQAIQKVVQFYPNYSESNIKYARENNIHLEVVKSDLTLFYNGRWVFNFNQPFFTWYNQILLDELKNFNHWVKQTHLGMASNQKKIQLENLLARLS